MPAGPADSIVVPVFSIGGPSTQQKLDRLVNEQLIEPRMTQAIEGFKREAAQVAPEPPPPAPETIHHPIDEAQQTGESRLLGGAMQIRAPWAPGAGEEPPAG